MLREEEKDQASSPGKNWRTYSRSVSWSERRKSSSGPQWNSKARACLPPLQPLSIIRPTIEDWPKAGSDDLGVWPNPPTPGAKPHSSTPRENPAPDREFECRKDKLAFFDKECSRILNHIYLGSDAVAKNRETLLKNGITHVLNCVGFSCPEYFKNELVYKTLWLQDCPSEDITSILYDVFDYFEDVREQGGRVFVHCCHGVSRSTSLVIAYLMWREGKSFDDAFEFVKMARGVTNPNVGFACQLLQCQKRVHAQPASPTSLLKMYRIAPHSPYDPLHLVPKMLSEPGPGKLDSRGAFIVHVPSGLFVWIGKCCPPVMSEKGFSAALQFIRYERAKGPVVTVKEGEESFEFWEAFCFTNGLKEKDAANEKKLDEYDLDFDIFQRALSGGVVPPFPLAEVGPETCLPVRENGWNRLRAIAIRKEIEENVSGGLLRDSPDSLASSYVTSRSSPCWPKSNLTRSQSLNLVESFSSLLVNKPLSSSTSPSASPSTSDYSSSFTVSPASSDLSFVSAQSSPYVTESKDEGSLDESMCFGGNIVNSPPPPKEKDAFACRVLKAVGLCSTLPLLSERRGMILLPSIDEACQVSENSTRYSGDDDVAKGREYVNFVPEGSFQKKKEEGPVMDANCRAVDEKGVDSAAR
ncbi:Protein-tyrosine-phosphatase MKP1 [Striga hermonthica]|uniref:Protein-tyrosine-phosphatase MKP1 n=1 Tax=Striga hermonthica TaxID=68872 RepID=A0A9N7MTB7_STRHE|nr:Protein-tyrosine-phosphatase MKP1 [Striga hermonthica]